MRKVLVAIATAAALFAVGAFAATFADVNAEDVASGNDPNIDPCAASVDIDFTGEAWDDTEQDWLVNGATITFYDKVASDTTRAVTGTCDGFDATLVVQDAGGLELEESSSGEVGASTTGVATVSFTATAVGDIEEASVLVDGKSIDPA